MLGSWAASSCLIRLFVLEAHFRVRWRAVVSEHVVVSSRELRQTLPSRSPPLDSRCGEASEACS